MPPDTTCQSSTFPVYDTAFMSEITDRGGQQVILPNAKDISGSDHSIRSTALRCFPQNWHPSRRPAFHQSKLKRTWQPLNTDYSNYNNSCVCCSSLAFKGLFGSCLPELFAKAVWWAVWRHYNDNILVASARLRPLHPLRMFTKITCCDAEISEAF